MTQNKKSIKPLTTIILQERDLTILEFVAKFGAVSDLRIKHVIDLLENVADYNASKIIIKNYNRIILRLINAGYIKKTKLVAAEHNYITLNKNGAALLGVKYVKQLVLPKLRHDMLVLDLYCNLKITNPTYNFTSEYELKQKSNIYSTKFKTLVLISENYH